MATIVEGYSEAHLNFWHLSFFNMTFWDYFEKMYKQIKSILAIVAFCRQTSKLNKVLKKSVCIMDAIMATFYCSQYFQQ